MTPLPQYLGPARSLCPECLAEAPGGYFAEGGQVILRRHCAVHGTIASPFWGDVEHYRWSQRLEAAACCAPGPPGCDGGAGPKRCVSVLPITDACNLECPYCFAASNPRQAHRDLGEIEAMLQGAIREAAGPTPLQLSGGEPTVHPDILDIIRLARSLGYRHIEVNTNGILVASRPGFALALVEAGADALYLQFDGVKPGSHLATRGRDLLAVKERAVDAAREAGLTVVLAPTVVKGWNDHELGGILDFALRNRDVVRGVNFQPVRHFGRYAEDTGHLSLDMVAGLLEAQTGFLRARELLPFPCCSSACFLATVLLVTPAGPLPLTRFLREEGYLEALRAAGDRRFMDILAGTPSSQSALGDIACACALPMGELAAGLAPGALSVAVTGFMDAHTVDVDRMERCCVRVVTRAGRLAPFCGYYLTDACGSYAWRSQHYPEDRGLPLPAPSPEPVQGA